MSLMDLVEGDTAQVAGRLAAKLGDVLHALTPVRPSSRMAAVRYFGSWSEKGWRRNEILIPVATTAD